MATVSGAETIISCHHRRERNQSGQGDSQAKKHRAGRIAAAGLPGLHLIRSQHREDHSFPPVTLDPDDRIASHDRGGERYGLAALEVKTCPSRPLAGQPLSGSNGLSPPVGASGTGQKEGNEELHQ